MPANGFWTDPAGQGMDLVWWKTQKGPQNAPRGLSLSFRSAVAKKEKRNEMETKQKHWERENEGNLSSLEIDHVAGGVRRHRVTCFFLLLFAAICD